jgi:SOS response associated peptidase (SRAP)
MWREPFAKRRCLVPASGLYEWPKEGHAISPTYTPEPVIDEASAGSVDLFATPAPAKKTKAAKPWTEARANEPKSNGPSWLDMDVVTWAGALSASGENMDRTLIGRSEAVSSHRIGALGGIC